MGNAGKFVIISSIIAIFTGICAFSLARYLKFEVFGIVFCVTFVSLMIYFYWYRCPQCENLFALRVTNTELLDTNEHKSYLTEKKNVGVSVDRNRYGEVIGETAHYMDVDYVTTRTVKTYENTYVCKYCGALSKKQFKKHRDETHRY